MKKQITKWTPYLLKLSCHFETTSISFPISLAHPCLFYQSRLVFYGIGINAQENFLETVQFTSIIFVQYRQALDESVVLLFCIFETIFGVAIEQVMGYVVVGEQLVCHIDSPINCRE